MIQSLFKNSKGEPYIPTKGQCSIFEAITNPNYKWVWISATTRYGKSDNLSIALIYLAKFHNLKIPIVAGSQEKANKIMEYVVSHLSDHPSLSEGLIGFDATKVEKLKTQVSKAAIKWIDGGWIYITSVDSRNIKAEGEGVVGEGGDIVVLEEAGLIKRREQFSKIVRMVEGDWGKLVMSGNAVENSVFEDAYNDPAFYKIRITLDQAIEEGRINLERLEQQKKLTTQRDWERYYLVQFPPNDSGKVFRGLDAVLGARPAKPLAGHNYLAGVDLAKHQDYTVIVIYDRNTNEQVYLDRFNQLDWTVQKRRIKAICNYYNNCICRLDATGLGDPIADDLIRDGVRVDPVKLTSNVKKEIIDNLVIKIEQQQIRMINTAQTVEEFTKYTYEQTATGQIRYNAPEGFHDDIVIAHALAVSGLTVIRPVVELEDIPPIKRAKMRALAKRKQRQGIIQGHI